MDKKKELCKIAAQILNVANECGKDIFEWIPVSERLPDEGQDVLITDGELIWVCDLVRTDCGYKWEDDYGYWHPLYDWKAWMPLPAPYTESEVEDGKIY